MAVTQARGADHSAAARGGVPRMGLVTAGVDLSTQRGKTSVAVVRWDGGSARVTDCYRPTDDGFVLDLVRGAAKVGVDSPLGWPDEFVRFLTDHAAAAVEVRAWETGEQQRRRLTWRLTDQVVRAAGHQPLTVAADKIGHVAMRAARLLALLAAEQLPVDRAGSGVVVEVYPAASLKRWGSPTGSTRGRRTPVPGWPWWRNCVGGCRGSTSASRPTRAGRRTTRSTPSSPR